MAQDTYQPLNLSRLVSERTALAEVARAVNSQYNNRAMPPIVQGILSQLLDQLGHTEAQLREHRTPILFAHDVHAKEQ